MQAVAALALSCLVATAGLAASGVVRPAALAHLAFAGGVLPLILAAIMHLIPVLTRTGSAPRIMQYSPLLAQALAPLVVLALDGTLPVFILHLVSTVDALLVLTVLLWLFGRVRQCLGPAHPGWRWYAAALSCFLLALLTVPFMLSHAEAYAALRRFHLHLNTLGGVGLAALGTLPVLLPTALGLPDPAAAVWMRSKFGLLLLAVAGLVFGATFSPVLAMLSGGLLFFCVLKLLPHWLRIYSLRTLLGSASACGLFSASCGLLLLCLLGPWHALGGLVPHAILGAWGALFLLPLITGALTHLLPVWIFAGPVTPRRRAMQDAMGQGGNVRYQAFFLGGLAFLASNSALGIGFCLLGLFHFVFCLLQAVCRARSTG